jgi:hypothetical protein
MASDTFDPTVVKGDTLRWQMVLTNSSGTTYDLTGITLIMQVRKSYYPGPLLFQATLGVTAGSQLYTLDGITGGISALGTAGTCNIAIGSNYTINFSEYTGAYYDIQAIQPNNAGVDTLLRGKINVLPDVTEI